MKYNKLFAALSGCLLLAACSETQDVAPIGEDFEIIPNPTSLDITSEKNQMWHAGNKRVIIYYGYNFNSPEFVADTTELLINSFGAAADDGLIETIVFPDDFKHGQRGVVSDFKNFIDSENDDIAGILILGAPEKTHRALAQLQDSYDGQIPFPVISFFPQDDILGVEDTSSLVIDRVQADAGNLEETEFTINVSDAAKLVQNAVEYLLLLDGPVTEKETLGRHAAAMLPGVRLRRYTDSESGIYSINHFVIE